MRLDRWFKVHYPGLGFVQLQKLLRSGQVRVDGGRAKTDTRIEPGQMIRVPPLGVDRKGQVPLTARTMRSQGDGDVLAQMLLYEDPKVFVFNKPAGFAVQGSACRAMWTICWRPAQSERREAAPGASARS
jgi:23S rRNA pseudouridine955/2504/2580 synthase